MGQNFARNWLVQLFLGLGRQKKSIDGSFNAILDHVADSCEGEGGESQILTWAHNGEGCTVNDQSIMIMH